MKAALAFLKGLADANRLRVLAVLRDRELCVCELCNALKLSQSTLSTHLIVLRDSGAVQTRKEGKWIYYALNSEFKRLLDTFFARFAALGTDKQIERDKARVSRRLRLRKNGCCTVGFDHLNSK